MVKRIVPGPEQESVWDYPRPPRVEPVAKRVRIVFNGVTIVDTRRARRVLETSHPPVYYIPPEEVQGAELYPTTRRTFCEFKGAARYWTLKVGDRSARDVAWSYPDPTPDFASIAGYLAFYPSRMDACFIEDEQVTAQEGDFYGGWITSDIVGPFKGGPGTTGW
ncbi:MAG: DUF427 domain-containing protein [Anaerolineae bacterium]|nr:DUF427 domain-containing protein [Anaerolineae bacterium]